VRARSAGTWVLFLCTNVTLSDAKPEFHLKNIHYSPLGVPRR
jgi:hypothetical protein